jgi:hypothetical protein
MNLRENRRHNCRLFFIGTTWSRAVNCSPVKIYFLIYGLAVAAGWVTQLVRTLWSKHNNIISVKSSVIQPVA